MSTFLRRLRLFLQFVQSGCPATLQYSIAAKKLPLSAYQHEFTLKCKQRQIFRFTIQKYVVQHLELCKGEVKNIIVLP